MTWITYTQRNIHTPYIYITYSEDIMNALAKLALSFYLQHPQLFSCQDHEDCKFVFVLTHRHRRRYPPQVLKTPKPPTTIAETPGGIPVAQESSTALSVTARKSTLTRRQWRCSRADSLSSCAGIGRIRDRSPDRGPSRNGVSFKVKGERHRNSSASRDASLPRCDWPSRLFSRALLATLHVYRERDESARLATRRSFFSIEEDKNVSKEDKRREIARLRIYERRTAITRATEIATRSSRSSRSSLDAPASKFENACHDERAHSPSLSLIRNGT